MVAERKFKKTLKIKDLKKAGLKPSDIVNASDDWDIMIALLNAYKLSGPKITDNMSVEELNKLQQKALGSFLEVNLE